MNEIEKLKSQIAEMSETIKRFENSEKEKNKWAPTAKPYYVNGLGSVCPYTPSHSRRIEAGTVYQTQQQGIWAARQMKKFNILLCYLAEQSTWKDRDIDIKCDHGILVINIPASINVANELKNKITSGQVTL